MTMTIKYPDNNLGKFIDLYGFSEIFNQIPKTITTFEFENESNSPIEIVLPEEFSELKNIENLNFKNCLSEIPEVIGKMESVTFLIFNECPNLDFIPPFIAKLPNLQALVLSNCSPNLVISPEVKERFENPNNSAFLDIE
jgi:Leucine-rich repeat (LRR) protein